MPSAGTATVTAPEVPPSTSLDSHTGASAQSQTSSLLSVMLRTAPQISDLFFSPGKPPMVEVNGRLIQVGARSLTPDDTRQIANDLIGDNQYAHDTLANHGSCDVSYSLPGASRFRVNVFKQRGTYAIVMRVIPGRIPTFEELRLPQELRSIAGLRDGIVLVTGPTGSGKSSTLAAIIDLINKQHSYHILTIEDP